jgi:hypothetical protein
MRCGIGKSAEEILDDFTEFLCYSDVGESLTVNMIEHDGLTDEYKAVSCTVVIQKKVVKDVALE